MPIHEDRIRPVLPSEALPPRSDKQDLTAQTQALLDLGVKADRADLIRHRTREGMAIARSKGKLRGKQPKLSDLQQKELVRMRKSGEYSISDLAELFSVSRPTVYRTLAR
jgi:hypothetical protein